ncbi:ribosome biogenesis protein SLX9 homolog [Drosophila bipectinata]|uniref:ribosome biogenesis protein SLX9 homolog n=1 Tax=Drosophila bipectinata TaxID=42026 RepID=UPI001C89FE86|nr:protein FAM207A [Drosophila bipectinata]
MAKTKRNVRAKAKSVVGAAKQKAQELQAKLRQENLLHKTLTPKSSTTKKEKSALKHKKLLKKFAETRKERKEETARKNREKTKVIGDLKPLKDALPSLQDIYNLVKTKQKDAAEKITLTEPEAPLSANEKIRKKRTEVVNRVKSFEKVIKDKKFKQNPREVIAAHVRNKYQAMEEDDE